MPDNWNIYKLGDIANLVTGKLNSNQAVETGKYPFFTCSPVTLKINKYAFNQEAILLAGNNANGIYSIKHYKGKFNAYQRTYVIDSKNKTVHLKFLSYLLGLRVNYLQDISQGTATKFLTIGLLKNLEVNLPPLHEQKKIASILSALDEKIELNLQMNKTLEEMAMALYKHWFVDFGPFQEGEFVDSELGEIPKGWEVKKIGELYNTKSGGTPSRKKPEYYQSGEIPWVKSKELYGDLIIETEEKINELGLKKSSAKLIPAKSVLLAMYGATVGESSILSMESACNQAICAILKKDLSYIYIFLYLRYFKSDILNQATGSAQQNISQQIIKNINIISPPVNLRIYNELEDMYHLIEQKLFENSTLSQLRDTLLPKLISGEVRVKEAEKILSEVL